MRTTPPVTIIGCGVIGLSCGITCLERGWATEIIARDLPPQTMSNKAGAVWFPFKAAPRDLVGRWSAATYRVYAKLAQDPASGVYPVALFDLHDKPDPKNPWWAADLPGNRLRRAAPGELPPGYVDGFVLQTYIIDPDKHLDFLTGRFRALGGVIRQQELNSWDDLDRPVVLNCTGLGARLLARDSEVYPISGHIAVVRPRRPVRCLMDRHGKNALAYIFPLPQVCKLGGTTVDHDWHEVPDPGTVQAIIARCCDMEPALADAEFIGAYVGLRPGRRAIRFEKEIIGPGRFVFHNYGHGGSGYTVNWGCASDLGEALSRELS